VKEGSRTSRSGGASTVGAEPVAPADVDLSAAELIDLQIQQLAQAGRTRPVERGELDAFASAVAAHPDVDMRRAVRGDGQGLSALLSSEVGSQGRRFIAACLLRLLNAAPQALDAPDVSPRVAQLFDDVFGQTLYRSRTLPRKLVEKPSFEKLSALSDVVRKFEADLSAEIEALDSSAAFRVFRRDLTAKLAGDLGEAVVAPFLPLNFVPQFLNPALAACEEYLAADPVEAVGAHEEALGAIERMEERATLLRSKYTVELIAPLGARLRRLIEGHYAQNPANAPARLSLEATEKRYPLAVRDAEIDLQLVLRNEGPGVARNVTIEIDSKRLAFVDATRVFPVVPPGGIALGFLGQCRAGDSSTPAARQLTRLRRSGLRGASR
jgi:hypothetical protein